MNKLFHVQTLIEKDKLEKLKSKTGYATTKDALYTAIEHFLNCSYSEGEGSTEKRLILSPLIYKPHKSSPASTANTVCQCSTSKLYRFDIGYCWTIDFPFIIFNTIHL